MLWRGFHSFSPGENSEGGLSFDHYRELFFGYGSSFYLKTLGRTILVSIVVTLTSIMCALPVAYTITSTQNRRTRRFALIMLLVPFMMGESVRTIGWFLILGNNGALSWVTSFFGREIGLLGSIIAIWVGMLQVMFPIATLVLLPAMTKIDRDLERAARSMGGKSTQVWLRIILPLSRPGILSALLVVLTLSMTEFAIPRILGQGKHPFVANTIQQIYFERGNVNFGSALSTVLLLAVVVMVLTIGYFGKSRV
jgi:putative spermidine/putrescine transport system permease protein